MTDGTQNLSPAVLLEVAGRTYRTPGARVAAIRDELGISDVRSWQLVNRVLDDPAPAVALQHGPTINRLRRLREAGQRNGARAERPLRGMSGRRRTAA